MKLFEVEVVGYVAAETYEDARQYAVARLDLACCDVSVHRVTANDGVHANWINYCPLGDQDSGHTCGEMLQQIIEQAQKEAQA